MRALSAADILDVWEVGQAESLTDRTLTLLERSCPEGDRDALARLPLGARDRLLLEVRAGAIGETLEATAECPSCGELLEFDLAVEDLLGRDPRFGDAEDPPSGEEEELVVAGYELRFRLLDSTDLLAVGECPDVEAARATLVERCVVVAHQGEEKVAASDLPPEVVAALAERLADRDPHVETLIDLSCPACAGGWRTDLDLAGFVWQEIRARALRLLDEVDTLARAYGWSEGEILALGAARRRSYMERAI